MHICKNESEKNIVKNSISIYGYTETNEEFNLLHIYCLLRMQLRKWLDIFLILHGILNVKWFIFEFIHDFIFMYVCIFKFFKIYFSVSLSTHMLCCYRYILICR